MPLLFDVNRAELASSMPDQPRYRVDQIWDGIYRQLRDVRDLSNVPAGLRDRLAERFGPALAPAAETVADDGDTVKWLWDLHDGTQVETVLMRYPERTTVCVSTQAGCAMGCGFCATGQTGFGRNLSIGEIVEQVIRAARRSQPRRVSNVVFMGMGEPLANYEPTWAAVRRLHDDLGIGARHLTVSTVGIVPGIERMASEDLPVNLAVSLHAANDRLRDDLVPINRRYPLGRLVEACRDYFEAKGRRISFEWALIDGVNDRGTDATELAELARSVRAHVNLIPLNPTPGYPARGTPPERVRAFCDLLVDLGVTATVRQNRGTSIDAACGQLRAAHEPTPVTVRPTP